MVLLIYLDCGHFDTIESEIIDGLEVRTGCAPEEVYCEKCKKNVLVIGEDAMVSTVTIVVHESKQESSDEYL